MPRKMRPETHEFPANAPAAFFSVHTLKDSEFTPKHRQFIRTGKPVLVSDGLAQQLTRQVKLDGLNVHILPVKGAPKSLLQPTQRELDELRLPLLRPFHATFHAPSPVAPYLFRDGSWVVENITDETVTAELNGRMRTVAARGWQQHWNK